MLNLLRVYLYWSILWGFLVHPALGLRSIVPGLLMGMDLLMMLGTTGYILAHRNQLRDRSQRRVVQSSLICLAVFIAYGLFITAINGGSLMEGAKYLGVLSRPVLLASALFIYAHRPFRGKPSARASYRVLRLDIGVLVALQLLVAGLQLVDPATGAEFVGVHLETQSAAWALDEGDVSGTFANSIDLAYFLLAAYIVLSMESWLRKRIPSFALTAAMGFFINASGSATAVVCYGIYAVYLHVRVLRPKTRRWVVLCSTFATIALLFANNEAVTGLVQDKVENMMYSRLGLIFISLPGLLQMDLIKFLTGVGSDFNVVVSLLQSLPDVPLVFTYDDVASTVNDVFWVAMVLALGLPATAYYLMKSAQLYRCYLQGTHQLGHIGSLILAVGLVVFLAGWLNQILAVRSFVIVLLLGLLPLTLDTTSWRAKRRAKALPVSL